MISFYKPKINTSHRAQSSIITQRASSHKLLQEKGQITSAKIENILDKDVAPHPERTNFNIYKQIFERVPLVSNAFTNTSDFAIQAGWEFEGSDSAKNQIIEFYDKFNVDLLKKKIILQMQIYGNSYLEIVKKGTTIVDLKLLPANQMFVKVKKGGNEDGMIIGYKQFVNNIKGIDFALDEIIHFKWNDATHPFYGISDIRFILGTVQKFMNWQEDLGQILHRYASPIIHWKLGNDEFPITQTEIDDFKNTLEQREVGEDIITSNAVESNTISATNMIQIDGMVKNLENQLIAGLRLPSTFVRGGESSNKATAQVELQAFDRRVKAIQRVVGSVIEDKLFPLITGRNSNIKIVWNEFSAEGELMRAQRLQTLISSGIPVNVSLKMVGLGSWVDDFEKARKEEEEKMDQIDQKAREDTKQPQEKQDEYYDQYTEEYINVKNGVNKNGKDK